VIDKQLPHRHLSAYLREIASWQARYAQVGLGLIPFSTEWSAFCSTAGCSGSRSRCILSTGHRLGPRSVPGNRRHVPLDQYPKVVPTGLLTCTWPDLAPRVYWAQCSPGSGCGDKRDRNTVGPASRNWSALQRQTPYRVSFRLTQERPRKE
jgi:hypothetical protein